MSKIKVIIMKRTIMLSLLCVPMILCAQSYFPEDMIWKTEVETFCNWGESNWKSEITETKVEGTTTINGIEYQLIGGYPVREENNRIYCNVDLGGATPIDVLLYDFNLQVGEQISCNYYDDVNVEYIEVIETDFITLLDGRKAKRITFSSGRVDVQYIGCVSSWGNGLFTPLSSTMPPCQTSQFLCCSVKDEPLYETSQGACSKVVSDINNIKASLQISLSSDGNILTINTLEPLEQIAIYNLNGQCVLRTNQTQVDVSALSEGMYLLQAINTERYSKQIKFIKH